MLTRRNFFRGAATLIAAPAIVRASSLMAVSPVPLRYFEVRFSQAGLSNIEAWSESWTVPIRENLSDLIFDIDPTDTPFLRHRASSAREARTFSCRPCASRAKMFG